MSGCNADNIEEKKDEVSENGNDNDDDNNDDDDDDEEDCSWQDELQCYRMLIVERVKYPFIAAALQSVRVIDHEDDEELMNPFINRTTKMRTNRLVDIVLKKGEANYKKFLQVLGILYPDIYTEITNKKPPDASTLPFLPNKPGRPDNIELIQLLMQALEGMKQKVFETDQQLKKTRTLADDRGQEVDRLKEKVENLSLRVSRYETIDNEMASLRSEAERVKNENYTICMRMIESTEENRQLRVSNMNIKNENDKLTLDLQRVKRRMDVETNKSVRLRHKLDESPSERDVHQYQKEIAELKLRLAKANNNQELRDENSDMRIQILRKDKDEALDMYAEAVENLHKLRDGLATAETLRDKYLDEKEQLTLTCSALQSDCDMYKMRRDAMWQQLQEVEKEREMLMKERNEAQLNTKTCMEEKARYRGQIRELEKKHDEVARKYLESERELIRLRRPRASTAEIDKFLTLPKASECYTSSSSVPTVSSSHERSEIPPEKGPFRPRAYITKYYEKYVKPKNNSDTHQDQQSAVFPEIELAADYSPTSKFPPDGSGKRRRRLGRNRRTAMESSVCDSVSSNSSNDENN